MTRRGSTKAVGRPKFEVNAVVVSCTSLAMLSSAVLFKALSTSTRSSILDVAPSANDRDSRRSRRVCDDPASAARLEQHALPARVLRQRHLRRRGPRLAGEVLDVAGEHQSGPRHVDAAHGAEDARPVVGQAAVGRRQIVRIAAEGQSAGPGGGERADLRARGAHAAARLQSDGAREGQRAERLPPVRPQT